MEAGWSGGDPALLKGRQRRAYSALTRRRAELALRHLAPLEPRLVADYYHRLEALESQLPAEQRAASRREELLLGAARPPCSPYLRALLPGLYRPSAEVLARPSEDALYSGAVARHCAAAGTSLRDFVLAFRDYALKNNVNPTVSNAAFFIKHQAVRGRQLQERLAAAVSALEGDGNRDGVSNGGEVVTDCNDNVCVDEEAVAFGRFMQKWQKVKDAKGADGEKLELGRSISSSCEDATSAALEENINQLTISLRKYGHL